MLVNIVNWPDLGMSRDNEFFWNAPFIRTFRKVLFDVNTNSLKLLKYIVVFCTDSVHTCACTLVFGISEEVISVIFGKLIG